MTLRELLWMAKAHTAEHAGLMCLIANANRDPKRNPRPFPVEAFDVLAAPREEARSGRAITEDNIDRVTALFVDQ